MSAEQRFLFFSALPDVSTVGAARFPITITGSWVKNGTELIFTKQDLEDAKLNFEKLENHNLNVDYDHASEDLMRAGGEPTPSAGRIFSILPPEPFQDGQWILYGMYEPTERARGLIRNREYRYSSAAFTRNFPDRHTGEYQGLVLTSVALTNDPFLDALPEIRLSAARSGGENTMSMLRLRRVGNRHEASIGNKYVGDIDDDHLRDYVSSLPPKKLSRFSGRQDATLARAGGPNGDQSVRKELAEAVRARQKEILIRQPNIRPDKAFQAATEEIRKEFPGLLSAYRRESQPPRG